MCQSINIIKTSLLRLIGATGFEVEGMYTSPKKKKKKSIFKLLAEILHCVSSLAKITLQN